MSRSHDFTSAYLVADCGTGGSAIVLDRENGMTQEFAFFPQGEALAAIRVLDSIRTSFDLGWKDGIVEISEAIVRYFVRETQLSALGAIPTDLENELEPIYVDAVKLVGGGAVVCGSGDWEVVFTKAETYLHEAQAAADHVRAILDLPAGGRAEHFDFVPIRQWGIAIEEIVR